MERLVECGRVKDGEVWGGGFTFSSFGTKCLAAVSQIVSGLEDF